MVMPWLLESRGLAAAATTPVQQRHYPLRSGHLMVFCSIYLFIYFLLLLLSFFCYAWSVGDRCRYQMPCLQ